MAQTQCNSDARCAPSDPQCAPPPIWKEIREWNPFPHNKTVSTMPNTQHAGGRPHVRVTINNLSVSALIDSGAAISAIRSDLVKQFQWSPLPSPTAPLFANIQDVQGRPLQVTGHFQARIKGPGGLTISFPLYAIANLESQCILGCDFQRATGTVISAAEHAVFFQRPNGPSASLAALNPSPPGPILMETAHKILLKPNESRWAILKLLPPPSLALRPGAEVIILSDSSRDYNVLDSLLTMREHNTIMVPIANHTGLDIHLPAGAPLPASHAVLSDDLVVRPAKQTLASLATRGRPPDIPVPPQLTAQKKAYLLANLDLQAVPLQHRHLYTDFVLRNHDVFSGSKFDLGHSTTIQHKINLRNPEPVYVPQFRIPHHHQETILAHVKEWLQCDVIKRCHSPYNSPIFCVEKPNGQGLRLVQDLRSLNKNSLDDKYCIRDAKECIDTLGKARSTTFSTLDLSGAFHQLSLHPDSRLATAFTVPFLNAQFCWLRTPMGCKGAPSSFSRLMGLVFEGMLDQVITYVDDALCHSTDHKTHIALLDRVAARLRSHGLKLNVIKCGFGRAEVEYLGFRITKDGVSPAKDKVRALRAMMPPTSPEKCAEFVGFANYFRSMVRNFALLSAPLSQLTPHCKSSTWTGGKLPPSALVAFRQIIDILCSDECMLAFPNPNKHYFISVDAALGDVAREGGLGAILTQQADNGQERVVSYWSRRLRTHEKNYSAYGLELLAACDALAHFHEYVYGSTTVLRTDHAPVAANSKIHQKTLNRLHELLNVYDVEVVYRAGAENAGPDGLSRNAMAAVTAGLPQNFTQAQAADPFAAAVFSFLQEKSLPPDPTLARLVTAYGPKCFVDKGQLWFMVSRKGGLAKARRVVPYTLVPEVIKGAHGSPLTGHWGVDRTIERCLNDFFWPHLATDVATFIRSCRKCQEISDPKGAGCRTRLRPWEQASGPNVRVHADLCGPLRSSGENKHILVMTCAFSKFVELTPIPNKEAATVASAIFGSWVCRYGPMEKLVTDGGREFANKTLHALLNLMGARQLVNSPLHPQAAGAVERFNREMGSYLRAFVDDDTLNWEEFLPALQFAHNTSVSRSTCFTPHFLMFNDDPRLPSSAPLPQRPDNPPTTQRLFDNLLRARTAVHENNEAARQAYSKYYNKRAKERTFQVGDRVLVLYDTPPPGVNRKLYRPWKGIFRVQEVRELDTLSLIRLRDNKVLPKIHVNRVKHFHDFDDTDQADLEIQPPALLRQTLPPSVADASHSVPHSDPVYDRGALLDFLPPRSTEVIPIRAPPVVHIPPTPVVAPNIEVAAPIPLPSSPVRNPVRIPEPTTPTNPIPPYVNPSARDRIARAITRHQGVPQIKWNNDGTFQQVLRHPPPPPR